MRGKVAYQVFAPLYSEPCKVDGVDVYNAASLGGDRHTKYHKTKHRTTIRAHAQIHVRILTKTAREPAAEAKRIGCASRKEA